MGKPKNIDFERCTSGINFEEWTKKLLIGLRMEASRVGKNDCGVDIIQGKARPRVLHLETQEIPKAQYDSRRTE